MKNETINGETVQHISGNVVFTKGTLTLKCQNGKNNQNLGTATLFDSVYSIQNNRNLTCDTLLFFSKENKIISFGNPHLWDKNYELFADTIIVFTKSDSGVALGSVTLKQKGQIINSDRLEYKKSDIDSSVSYSAIGKVLIRDSLRVATCGMANYQWSKEITSLEIEPKISENKQIISGEKIILIERYLDGDAMMQHAKNISEGGILETHFVKFMEHFTINKIDVYGNASDELKEFVKPFGLPFYFHPEFAKFSRN